MLSLEKNLMKWGSLPGLICGMKIIHVVKAGLHNETNGTNTIDRIWRSLPSILTLAALLLLG